MEEIWNLSDLPQQEQVNSWLHREEPMETNSDFHHTCGDMKVREADSLEDLELNLRKLFVQNCLSESARENFSFLRRVNGIKLVEEQRVRFFAGLGGSPTLASPYCSDFCSKALNGELNSQLTVRFKLGRCKFETELGEFRSDLRSVKIVREGLECGYQYKPQALKQGERGSLDIVVLSEDVKFDDLQRVKIFDLIRSVSSQMKEGKNGMYNPTFVFDNIKRWGGHMAVSEWLAEHNARLQSADLAEFNSNLFLYSFALLNTSVSLEDTVLMFLKTKNFVEVSIVYIAPSFLSSFGTTFLFLKKFFKSEDFVKELKLFLNNKSCGMIPLFTVQFPLMNGKIDLTLPLERSIFEGSRFFRGKLYITGLQKHFVFYSKYGIRLKRQAIVALEDLRLFENICEFQNEKRNQKGGKKKVAFFEFANVFGFLDGNLDNYFTFTNFVERKSKRRLSSNPSEQTHSILEGGGLKVKDEAILTESGFFGMTSEIEQEYSRASGVRRIVRLFDGCDALCIYETLPGDVPRITVVPLVPNLQVMSEVSLLTETNDRGVEKKVLVIFPSGVPFMHSFEILDFFDPLIIRTVVNPFFSV